MEEHFKALHQVVYVLAAALIVPVVWGETLSSATKDAADRLLSAVNPYVLDNYGVIVTAPDFDYLIAEVRQGMAEKTRDLDFSTEMTAFVAESPRHNELVMLGEFSSHCSITPSEFLDDYQQARVHLKEVDNQSSLVHGTEMIWKLYSFLKRKSSIQPQWAIVCGNGSDPQWRNALTLPSAGFQFQTVKEKKGREYAYYVDRSGVAFFF